MDNFNNQQQGFQQPMGQPMQQGYQQPQMQPQMQQMYQQPQMQQGYQQPRNMGYQQPFVSTSGMKFSVATILKLVSALFIFISPLLNWVSVKIDDSYYKEKEKKNLFKLAKDWKDYGSMFFIILAILLMLFAVIIALLALSDMIPAVASIKAKLANVSIEYIILACLIVIFIALYFCPAIYSVIKTAKEIIDEGPDGHANHGFGGLFLFVGIVVNIVSMFFKKKEA